MAVPSSYVVRGVLRLHSQMTSSLITMTTRCSPSPPPEIGRGAYWEKVTESRCPLRTGIPRRRVPLEQATEDECIVMGHELH
jgi:hypothetical protein